MPHYREVFKPKTEFEPGYVYYTITTDDVGNGTINTTAGSIHVGYFMGPVKNHDVGKRIYRMNITGIWQVESDQQYSERMEKEISG